MSKSNDAVELDRSIKKARTSYNNAVKKYNQHVAKHTELAAQVKEVEKTAHAAQRELEEARTVALTAKHDLEFALKQKKESQLPQDPRSVLKRYVRSQFGTYELCRVSQDDDSGSLWGLTEDELNKAFANVPLEEKDALLAKPLKRLYEFNDRIIDGLTDEQVQDTVVFRRLFPIEVLLTDSDCICEVAEGFIWNIKGDRVLVCGR